MKEDVCESCQTFLRIGIPVIAIVVLLVVGCIIWYDRYDDYRVQQQVLQKKNQTANHPYNNDIDSTENKSESDDRNVNDNIPSLLENGCNNNLEVAQEQSPSKCSITKSIPGIDFTRESLQIVSIADHEGSNEWNDDTTGIAPASTSIAHHLGILIERIRQEHLTPTIAPITISEDDEESQNDNNNQDDDDGQSSIESDATPIVENKLNNMIVLHDLSHISSPVKQQYTTTTFTEIGMIRNHLSLPGSTESESTTSISSSSSLSSYNDKSHDSNSRRGLVQEITNGSVIKERSEHNAHTYSLERE